MRITVFFLVLYLSFSSALAGEVTVGQARQKAALFMTGKTFTRSQSFKRAKGVSSDSSRVPFYIFNANEGGYVIVSADDRTRDILGYSATGTLDTGSLPSDLEWWLNEYARQIEALGENTVVASQSARLASASAVTPMIRTTWNQYEPYNYMCPDGNGRDYYESGYNTNRRCITGCVATAMAQVMNYWQWPESCPALDAYSTSNFDVKALPSTTFKWGLMKNSYSKGETGKSADAVAELMRYCGQSVQMDYTPNASAAGLPREVMVETFNYSHNIQSIARDYFPADLWEEVIYDELSEGRPVLYSGQSSESGHEFIVDGLSSNGLFHINWGWGGYQDNYFVLSVADPARPGLSGATSNGGYRFEQYALIGVKPHREGEIEPYAVLSEDSLTVTFYYDEHMVSRNGIGICGGLWGYWDNSLSYSTATTAIIDESFANFFPTSTSCWFMDCKNLKTISGLSNVQTDKVRNMSDMFYGCSSLTSLDVSGFKTDNVTSMSEMFRNCFSLTTIYAGDLWNTGNVIEGSDMFTGCTQLVGGAGTAYNADHVDYTYAHIDGGTANPGYFTDKNAPAQQVATPTFSVSNYSLVISTETDGADIYYTMDGTAPSQRSTLYTGPVTLTQDCTVMAIATRDGYQPSEVAEYVADWVDLKLAQEERLRTCSAMIEELRRELEQKATANEAPDLYERVDGILARIADVEIYLDRASDLQAVTVCESVIDEIRVAIEQLQEDIEAYQPPVVVLDQVATPEMAFDYSTGMLTISCTTEGSTIYYTTDGTDPTTAGTRYTAPVTLTRNCTVKALATAEGMLPSDIATHEVNWFTAAMPAITVNGLQIEMATATEGAAIRYTIDGSEPTDTTGTVYTAPVTFATLPNECTVQAIAVREGYNDSEIAAFEYRRSDYTTATPGLAFQAADSTVVISSATAGAVIRYTLDGTIPTDGSTVYTAPFNPMRNCTVTATATAGGMFTSEAAMLAVEGYRVQPVAFSFDGTLLTMTTPTAEAAIRYTTDGSEPADTTGTVYSGPVTIGNTSVTVRAIAQREGWTDSDVTSWNASQTATPTFAEDRANNTLTISCTTEGSTIYYTTDGTDPTTAGTRYTAPVTLTRNCTVKALATAEGMLPSDIATHEVRWLHVATPEMAFDYSTGMLTISCATSGSTIYYYIGTGETILYMGQIALTANVTVTAYATAEGYNNSETAMFRPIENGTREGDTFRISGEVSADELLFLRNILGQQVEHLDMEEAVLTAGELYPETFSGMSLLTARLPRDVGYAGEHLFDGCRRLAAVVWNAGTDVTAAALQGIGNPNLLLYVGRDDIGSNAGIANRIVNMVAQEITLSDPEGNSDCNFYCPVAFTAQRIAYSHTYTQQSGIDGECRGWETIALPFTVQTITHRVMGDIAPFGVPLIGQGGVGEVPHFWLCELGTSRFENATAIEANKPYIISMPQHPDYDAVYNLGGDVITFAATNATVPVTEPQTATTGQRTIYANFTTQAASDRIYTMNVGTAYDATHAEGSIFVPGQRAVRPFEAYTTSASGARYIELFGDEADGIVEVQSSEFRVQSSQFADGVYNLGGRRISGNHRQSWPGKRLVIRNGKVTPAWNR